MVPNLSLQVLSLGQGVLGREAERVAALEEKIPSQGRFLRSPARRPTAALDVVRKRTPPGEGVLRWCRRRDRPAEASRLGPFF